MSVWERLLPVQDLDTVLDQLRHRLASLPERAELAGVERDLAGLRSERAQVEAERHELARRQQRLEDEIASVTAKKEHYEAQLYSGGSDAKALQSIQDEIAALGRRIDALETQELEVMEEADPVDARLADLDERQSALDDRAIALSAAIAEAEATIDAEIADAESKRGAAAAAVADADALAKYERARADLGGVAVARLQGGICGGCHITLSAVEHDRIKHLPADEEVRCEECSRFLVRV